MNKHQSGGIRSLFLLACLGFPLPLFASGSYSSGGVQTDQSYNFGKAIFYKQVICDACPLAQSEPDNADMATKIVLQLNEKPESLQKLTDKEREAAIYYLKRRYELN